MSAITAPNAKTIGVSPKVLWPFALQLIGAVVLYVMGEHGLATALIGAAVATGVAGYAAPPGDVRPDAEPPDVYLDEPDAANPPAENDTL